MDLDTNFSNFSLNTLDYIAVKNFYDNYSDKLLDQYSIEEFLRSLGLMIDNTLTRDCFLLFSSLKPVTVKLCVCNEDKTIYKDIRIEKNNIYNLINICMSYINEHLSSVIPESALKEIILNSFIHADYNSLTIHKITITPSYLEIYNPGEFIKDYKPEDFKNKNINKTINNKKIYDILSCLTRKEDASLKNVYKICKKDGVAITYKLGNLGFWFIFKYKNDVRNDVINKLSFVDISVKNILIRFPDYTASQIGLLVGKSDRTIQRSMDKLKQAGILQRTGSKKAGFWQVNAS